MSVDDRLSDVFQKVFLNDDLVLADEMTAADIEGWDSLAHINLMFAIEQEFGFQFPGNELAELANIGALKEFIAQKGS
ncbi:MAG: acyl carrier protein [Hyphomonas sp.]